MPLCYHELPNIITDNLFRLILVPIDQETGSLRFEVGSTIWISSKKVEKKEVLIAAKDMREIVRFRLSGGDC